MKKFCFLIFCLFGFLFFLANVSSASIGVGVGTGKIKVDDPLKAGGIYELPALPVLNTGSETSDYEVLVQYLGDASELRPAREWFDFEPRTFSLDPSGVQLVAVTLTLPVKTEPGEYFAFLEARPFKKVEGADGITRIKVAAATKLYFAVAPANIFRGIYYRTVAIFEKYQPWSYIVSAVVILAIIILTFRSFFSFNLGISRKKRK